MKAIKVNDDQSLSWDTVDTPQPSLDEVQIKVTATALNRADVMQRAGLYPPPPGASAILGLECLGVVEALGAKAGQSSSIKVGDQVCALLSGGGYAETVVCPANHCIVIPKGFPDPLSFAGFAEVYATIYLNLFMEAGLTAGDKVIIHAGASGIGTAAIQVCKAMGVESFVTVSSENKLETCMGLGASAGHLRGGGSFVQSAKDWAGGKGVQAILDPVGGKYLEDNIACLAVDGKLIVIGLMGGTKAQLNIGLLLVKRLRVIGSTLRSRTNEQKAKIMAGVAKDILPLVERGEVKLITDRTFDIREAKMAFAYLEGNLTIGKVLLTL